MKNLLLCLLACFTISNVQADEREQCLLKALAQAKNTDTVAMLREHCHNPSTLTETLMAGKPAPEEQQTTPELHFAEVESTADNPFAITPYDRNYILPFSYNNTPNVEPFQDLHPNADMNKAEVKFQISLQARILEGIFSDDLDLWGAYTQQSWWQFYNVDESSPFRETNYQPELIFRLKQNNDILGFNNRYINFGYIHQSNGQGGSLSRSWNRLFASAELDRGNFAIVGRTWWRIPENEENDDNPDINEYLGYGDVRAAYKWQEQEFGITLRNNLSSDNKGAVQLDWTFPLSSRFKGYVQYFNGYGESLIDYNHSSNRIGVGIVLTDWL